MWHRLLLQLIAPASSSPPPPPQLRPTAQYGPLFDANVFFPHAPGLERLRHLLTRVAQGALGRATLVNLANQQLERDEVSPAAQWLTLASLLRNVCCNGTSVLLVAVVPLHVRRLHRLSSPLIYAGAPDTRGAGAPSGVCHAAAGGRISQPAAAEVRRVGLGGRDDRI